MIFKKEKNYTKFFAVVIALFGLALLTGCSGGSNKAESNVFSSTSFVSSHSVSHSSASRSPYVGQWYAPAYGYVVSINVANEIFAVETYSITKNYCILQNVVSGLPLNDLKQDYGYSNLAKELLFQNKGDYLPAVEYEKLEQLPEICKTDLQNIKKESSYIFDAKKDFEIFWQTFNELYINFELRGLNWGAVYDEAIKSVADIKDEDALFEFLSGLIAPLGDDHVVLIKAPLTQNLNASIAAALASDQTSVFSASTKLSLPQKLLQEYVQTLESDSELNDAQRKAATDYILDNHNQISEIIVSYANENADIKIRAAGEIFWFKTSNNIGYINIGSMDSYSDVDSTIASDVAIAQASIREALKDLANTDGLIVDVRFNRGGQDQVALTFVRHFMSKPQVVYSKFAGSGTRATPVEEVVLQPQSENFYLKPTAVLVSGDTVSAAELFTLAMASLPQVAIIGEPTAGALSDILVKRLTSDIAFGVSNETYLDTQGRNYEGIGIPVHIAVPFATLKERQGGYDNGLDRAIDWIKSAP